MEVTDKKNNEAITLPKCKFAGDNVETCEYCDHNVDERTTLLFIHEVLCEIDRKWHSASHVCRYWK